MVNSFVLGQCYPNPASSTTEKVILPFSLSKARQVVITLYDACGRDVSSLLNQYKDVVDHRVVFNPKGLLPGVYFYQLVEGKASMTRKMVVVK